uniref:Uncharacterized protein n=1 Tax=Picea glauca TaxID=3330 RepID=A0A101LY58_PICGL|nr:hypothetical protein ABT39_MTgene5707 [Picea glauca]QHR87182.1 hypothetical protein Q903MT_gene1191 [Picea sitchensis]QHR87308.1 hypothetical protein Q903MT_gene1318 [Picea sitchensis]
MFPLPLQLPCTIPTGPELFTTVLCKTELDKEGTVSVEGAGGVKEYRLVLSASGVSTSIWGVSCSWNNPFR